MKNIFKKEIFLLTMSTNKVLALLFFLIITILVLQPLSVLAIAIDISDGDSFQPQNSGRPYLAKVSGNSAVYWVEEGQRHLFPNSDIFWSYFDGTWDYIFGRGFPFKIHTISQDAFDSLEASSNVFARYNSLISFYNSNRIYVSLASTYSVVGDIVETTPDLVEEVFGSNWRSAVVSIPAAFESDYFRNDNLALNIELNSQQNVIFALQDYDRDGDGLSEFDEFYFYNTSDYVRDSDRDGYDDAYEVLNGYDPSGPGRLGSELVSIDDNWNGYTSIRLGFYIDVPKKSSGQNVIVEEGDNYIVIKTIDVSASQKMYIDEVAFDDIDQFIRDIYGNKHKLGSLKSVDDTLYTYDVYDPALSLNDCWEDLECTSGRKIISHDRTYGRAVTWNMGNGYTFTSGVPNPGPDDLYDTRMYSSFKIIN